MKYEKVKVNSKKWLDLKPLLNEEFKDVKNYEGIYQVSNYGRIKTLRRYIQKEYRGNRYQEERILKQGKVRNYYYVKLQKNKCKYNVGVHRLVAEAFIPNPNNLPEIDHKKPVNNEECINIVENLKWCTHRENMLENKETLRKINMKPIKCYDLNWKYIRMFQSINEASKELNLCHSSIKQCCEGHPHHKRVNKYRFTYANE